MNQGKELLRRLRTAEANNLLDTRNWCIYALIDHYEPTAGHVGCAYRAAQGLGGLRAPVDTVLVRDIARICEQVAKEF